MDGSIHIPEDNNEPDNGRVVEVRNLIDKKSPFSEVRDAVEIIVRTGEAMELVALLNTLKPYQHSIHGLVLMTRVGVAIVKSGDEEALAAAKQGKYLDPHMASVLNGDIQ